MGNRKTMSRIPALSHAGITLPRCDMREGFLAIFDFVCVPK
jgi:hypothetical protein